MDGGAALLPGERRSGHAVDPGERIERILLFQSGSREKEVDVAFDDIVFYLVITKVYRFSLTTS